MTPRSIDTGRRLTPYLSVVAVANSAVGLLAPARADRVALSVALTGTALTGALAGISIGPLVGGVLVPLTILNAGHPVCYLSVDKLGNAIFGDIRAQNLSGGNVTLGVCDVRQTQPLESE